jgi:hypothetical protein
MESPLPPFLLNGEKNLSSCQILLLQRVCQHEKGQWPLAPATCQACGIYSSENNFCKSRMRSRVNVASLL